MVFFGKKQEDTTRLVSASGRSDSLSVTSKKKYRLRRPKLSHFRKLSSDSIGEESYSGYIPPQGYPLPESSPFDMKPLEAEDVTQDSQPKKKINMKIKKTGNATLSSCESSSIEHIFDTTTENGSSVGDLSLKQQETKLTEKLTADESNGSDDHSDVSSQENEAHSGRFSQFVFDENFQEIKSVEMNSSTGGSSIFSMDQVAKLADSLRDGLSIEGLFRKKLPSDDIFTIHNDKKERQSHGKNDVLGMKSKEIVQDQQQDELQKRMEEERKRQIEDYSLISSIRRSTQTRRRDPDETSRKPDPSPKSRVSHVSERGFFQSPLKSHPSYDSRDKAVGVTHSDAILGSMLFRKTSPVPLKVPAGSKQNGKMPVPMTIEMTASTDTDVSGITEVGTSMLGIRPLSRSVDTTSIRTALMETYNMFEP